MAQCLWAWVTVLLLRREWVIVNSAESGTSRSGWLDLNLPEEHIPFFFHNNPHIREQCAADDSCSYKRAVNKSKTQCWGYEDDCPEEPRLPHCPGSYVPYAKSKAEQRQRFWQTADFGYVRKYQKELRYYCKPKQSGDSSLRCSDHLRYCKAKNIYIDFSTAGLSNSREKWRQDVIGPGQIGGHCVLNKDALQSQLDEKGALQSWAAEMEHYTSLPFRPIADQKCDVVISEPAYLIKLDGLNMYHHFCDYVNLYVSQHVNNSFSRDVKIIIWRTNGQPLHPVQSSFFIKTWEVFSKYPFILLHQFDGQKVCFKDAVFSVLPRAKWGLYFNMPLMPGCHGSSLIQAFSQHILHRLNILQHGPLEHKIRVTFLARSTSFRKVRNQNKLLETLYKESEFKLSAVDYTFSMPFVEQLEFTHNSDIFIGMHGAGLTHLLFLPDWAAIFELYNCEDNNCYYDLAQLRGIKYITWEKEEKLVQADEGIRRNSSDRAKFTNYSFDVEEFMRLVRKAADHVRHHPSFIAARQRKFSRKEHQVTYPQEEL